MTSKMLSKVGTSLVRRFGTRDPFQIAGELGISILLCEDFGSLKGMYRVIKRNRFIFLNKDLGDRMLRIVCAHELGHDRLHRKLARANSLHEFYLGLRPSECLGLTFGDIRPLYGHEDQIRCIYVYKQRKQDEAVDYRLKTHNAYRILPIPSELDALLRQREKGMRTRLDGDLSEYPIVCKDTKWITPCKRRTALELCAGLLRKEFKEEEVIADLTAEMNRDTAFEEKDITSYLLRRNFATAMVSVCGMEEDELQYLMGHDILDEQEVRSDFTDADFLARIWRKMNRRVLRENIPDEEKPIIVDRGECRVEGRSTMDVEVAEECFQDGNETVVLDLWNELPGDFISVRPNEQGDAREDDITIDASYEPVQPQKADRIDIAQDYCAAVQRVRKSSRKGRANKG